MALRTGDGPDLEFGRSPDAPGAGLYLPVWRDCCLSCAQRQ